MTNCMDQTCELVSSVRHLRRAILHTVGVELELDGPDDNVADVDSSLRRRVLGISDIASAFLDGVVCMKGQIA